MIESRHVLDDGKTVTVRDDSTGAVYFAAINAAGRTATVCSMNIGKGLDAVTKLEELAASILAAAMRIRRGVG